jgi:hypothetical protein
VGATTAAAGILLSQTVGLGFTIQNAATPPTAPQITRQFPHTQDFVSKIQLPDLLAS